jgi:hypothetical protein
MALINVEKFMGMPGGSAELFIRRMKKDKSLKRRAPEIQWLAWLLSKGPE